MKKTGKKKASSVLCEAILQLLAKGQSRGVSGKESRGKVVSKTCPPMMTWNKMISHPILKQPTRKRKRPVINGKEMQTGRKRGKRKKEPTNACAKETEQESGSKKRKVKKKSPPTASSKEPKKRGRPRKKWPAEEGEAKPEGPARKRGKKTKPRDRRQKGGKRSRHSLLLLLPARLEKS